MKNCLLESYDTDQRAGLIDSYIVKRIPAKYLQIIEFRSFSNYSKTEKKELAIFSLINIQIGLVFPYASREIFTILEN